MRAADGNACLTLRKALAVSIALPGKARDMGPAYAPLASSSEERVWKCLYKVLHKKGVKAGNAIAVEAAPP